MGGNVTAFKNNLLRTTARAPWWRRAMAAIHSDSGPVAVSFILCLPIFLTVLGIIVQLALLINAKIMINYAVDRVGRAAVTTLPEHQYDALQRAARLALVPLSPRAKGDATAEALQVWQDFSTCGAAVPTDLAARYTYATAATALSWSPSDPDYQNLSGRPVQITLHYKFYLTVPLIMSIVNPDQETVAGVSGHFFDISSICTIQTAHGRRAASDGNGWAQ